MLAVDTSALVFATTEATATARALLRRLRDEVCHAPHLVDAELGNVLRRKVARGELAPAHAEAVLAHASLLVDHRYGHTGRLASAAWGLRENLTFYDALFVVLAAGLGVPLVTVDARLAEAPDLPCRVELARAN